jgi:sirohydrochlorin ferrochelatase
MAFETLLLVGRGTARAREGYETHADRLAERGVADRVRVATYESEPVRELREELAAIDADRVYAIPMAIAHSFDTIEDVPAALSFVGGDVRYCEPLGRSPAVTDVILRRAADHLPAREDTSLVLVGFGSSSKPYHRQAVEYHATRLREESAYGAVLSCYLLQNPAVECVRYNVATPEAVAVPLFLTRGEATDERIPAKLEVDRGGIAYADPLGEHPGITDAIHAELERQRVLALGEESSFETPSTRNRRPVATDGEGPPTDG